MSHLWDLEGQCYPPTPTAFDNITPQYDQSSIEVTQWDCPPRDPFDALPRYQLNTPLPRLYLDRYHPDVAPPRYHPDVAPSRYHPEVSPPRYHPDVAPPRYHPSAPPPPPPRYHPEFKVSSPGSNEDQEPSTPSDTTMPETPDMTQFPYSPYTPSLPGACLAARRDMQLMVLEIQRIDGHIHKIPIPVLKNNRNFKCEFEQCTLAFGRKEHLSRHMLTHTGVRAHVCNFCHQRFSRSDNLRKHKLEIHEKKKGACRKFKPKSSHVKRHPK